MNKRMFRTYDIRGEVGIDFSLQEVPTLATAIATYIMQRATQARTIVIGRDNRTHSPAIATLLAESLSAQGFDIIDLGLVPTPALYYALHTLPVDAGIMITASHNGPTYNGLKISLGTQPIWGAELAKIYQLCCKKEPIFSTYRGIITPHDIIAAYTQDLISHCAPLKKPTEPLVIDCGCGATTSVIKSLIEKLGWQDQCIIQCTEDAIHSTHGADPSIAENCIDLAKTILNSKAFLGIAFDGDGDRMGALTHEGVYVVGDQLAALFAQQILETHPQAPIVYDVKCSQLLTEVIVASQGIPVMSPSGHSIIKEQMRAKQSPFGGELSGHFFFNDRWFGFDDGIYAALRLIEIIQQTQKSLDQLVDLLPKKYSSREFRVPCADEHKKHIVTTITNILKSHPGFQIHTIDGVSAYTAYGWGIIRASNTQPVLCVRGESDTPEGLERITHELFSLIAPHISHHATSHPQVAHTSMVHPLVIHPSPSNHQELI